MEKKDEIVPVSRSMEFMVMNLGELVQMGNVGGSNKVEGPNPKQTREHGWTETSRVN